MHPGLRRVTRRTATRLGVSESRQRGGYELLTPGVARDRVNNEHLIVPGRAMKAARRRKQQALDSGFLGLLGQPHGCEMVDVGGRLRVEVADRIGAHRREVDADVEADDVFALDVTDVSLQQDPSGNQTLSGPSVA
jgi:hypothetical protein